MGCYAHQTLIRNGENKMDEGKFSEALICFEKSLKLNTKNLSALKNKAKALDKLNFKNDAIQCYNKIIELRSDKNYFDIFLNKGKILFELKRYDDSIIALNKSIELKPDDREAYIVKLEIYLENEKFTNALNLINEINHLNDDNYYYHYLKGMVYYKTKKYELAIESFDRSIDLNYNFSRSHLEKANAFFKLENYLESIVSYNLAISFDSNHYNEIKDNKSFSKEILQNQEIFKINKEKIKLIEVIGKGIFGIVWKAEYGFTEVVVKLISNDYKNNNDKGKKIIQREINSLNLIRHPNLILYMVSYEDIVDLCPFICLVSEYCKGGDLHELLTNKKVDLLYHQKLKILLDIVAGMIYLHNIRDHKLILHRDLKTRNILLVDRIKDVYTIPQAKIADFGCSKIIIKTQLQQTLTCDVGTPFYTAPEILTSNKYGPSADVYSFGVIMWEIFTSVNSNRPSLNSQREVYNKPDLQLLKIGTHDDSVVKLIENCLSSEPKNRPNFEKIGEILKNIYNNIYY